MSEENELNELKRSDIDMPSVRNTNKNSYKNRKFNGRRSTVDEYTGNVVFYSQKAEGAKGKPRHYTTERTANVDHVIPIEVLKKRYGDNLTKEQYRILANSDYNLRITNERLNKQKQDKTNIQYLISELKKDKNDRDDITLRKAFNMVIAEGEAEIKSRPIAGGMQAANTTEKIIKDVPIDVLKKNAGDISGAIGEGTEEAIVALMVSAVNNIYAIGRGEKSVAQGAKDIAVDCGGSFASRTGIKLTQSTVSKIASKCGQKELAELALKELPIGEISFIITTSHSVVQMISGEISQEECVCQLLTEGIGSLAFMIGNATPLGPIGGAVLSIVVTNVVGSICTAAMKVIKGCKLSEKERRLSEKQIGMYINIANDALEEMEKQRAVLKKAVTDEFDRWDESFETGFDMIYTSVLTNNAEDVALGLDTILSVFDRECAFKTIEEFNDFFDDPDAVFTL